MFARETLRDMLRRLCGVVDTSEHVNIWTGATQAAVAAQYRPPGELQAVRTGLAEGVGLYGLLRAELGIGEAARRMARALRAVHHPVSAHAITLPELFEDKIAFETDTSLLSRFDTVLIHLNPDTLIYLLDNGRIPLDALIGRRRIGYWAWELPMFPPRWASGFDKVDEIWTLSHFSARVIANATDKPVRMVPLAVPVLDISRDEARSDFDLPRDATVFLTTFDFNSTPARKNPLGVIRAFHDAFPVQADRAARPDDGPILVLKYHGRTNRAGEYHKMLAHAAADPRLILIDEIYTEDRLRRLQAACDVYVSLHRSEGFGLNIAECMGAGKIAIATDFSGNRDFMTAENSLPIPYTARPLQRGEYYQGDGQWWAEPDHSAAVEAMRLAASGSATMATLGARAREHIRVHYSYEATGALARAALRGSMPPVDPG
jgi:glycosyltransferase involved in cell wall biosynthesis